MRNTLNLFRAFLLCYLVCAYNLISAQTLLKNMSSVNGTVNAVVKNGSTYYVGGNFSYVGLKTGAAALLNSSNDYPDMDFPGVNGTIYCSVDDGNGGWFLGGSISDVDGVPHYGLVHIKNDKTLDTSWQLEADAYYNIVNSLERSGDTLFIGGNFSALGGTSRNNLAAARISNGSLLSWNPNVNGAVSTILVKDTSVYIGGSFVSVSNIPKSYFACLSRNTGLPNSNVANTDGPVSKIIAKEDTLFIGGSFNQLQFNTSQLAAFTSSNDIPQPLASSGSFSTVIPDGNDGWYVGGSNMNLGGETRTGIAHITSGMSFDPSFDAGYINGDVICIVLDGSTLYIGGSFTNVGPFSSQRNRLAALNATSGALLSWNPNANQNVLTLENADTTIYAGGDFTKIGNKYVSSLAQIGKVSGIAIDITTGINGSVNKIVKQNDSLYVGGSFSGSGYGHKYLANLSLSSGEAAFSFPETNGYVNVSIPDGSGGWYVGGSFSIIGDSMRNGVAHILSSGTVDGNFNCTYDFNSINALYKDGSTLYLGGNFYQCGYYNCPPRSHLAAVNASTGNLLPWNPQPNGVVTSITKKDSYIYIGGSFNLINGVNSPYLAKLDVSTSVPVNNILTPNGAVNKILVNGDSLFVGGTFTNLSYKKNNLTAFVSGTDIPIANFPESDGTINCAIPDGSNGWIVGGTFNSIGGQARTSIARINSSGQVEPSWSVSLSNTTSTAQVYALAIIGSKLVIGGEFDQVNGVGGAGRTNITGVNLSNGANASWNNSVNGPVYALTSDGSSNIYAGGSFSQAGTFARQNLAKFNSAGTANNLWVKNANGVVRSLITLSPTSRIIAGGDFTMIGSTSIRYIAKLSVTDNTNVPITTWQPDPNGPVYTIANSNNRIYLGGAFQYVFTSTTQVSRNNIASVDSSNGVSAPTIFDPNSNGQVLQLNFDGARLTACGYFSSIYGSSRSYACLIDTAGSGSLSILQPEPNNIVNCFSKSGSTLLMGGAFASLKNSTRNYLAAISTSSGLLSVWNPDLNGYVRDISTSGTDLYVAGSFDYTNITNSPNERFGAASWNLTTGILNSWNPQLFFQSNGSSADLNSILYFNNAVYLGGVFDSSGIVSRSFLARTNTTTGTADAWNPEVNYAVNTISGNGSEILIGGFFTFTRFKPRTNLACISHSNGLPFAWNPSPDDVVKDLAISNSKLFVGGSFNMIGNVNKSSLARFNLNSLSNAPDSWNPSLSYFGNSSSSTINSIAIQNNKIYVGGDFDSAGVYKRVRIADIDIISGVASSWAPNLNSTVSDIACQGSNIVVVGSFGAAQSNQRNNIASMVHSTRQILSFAPIINYNVNSLTAAGNKLFVGGSFSYVNSFQRNGCASFNLNTGNLNSWDPNLKIGYSAGSVTSLFSSGSSVYISGNFDTVGTSARNYLVTVDTINGNVNSTWNPSPNYMPLSLQVNGNSIVTGGYFQFLKGTQKYNLAAIDSATGLVNQNFSPEPDNTVNTLSIAGSTLYVGGNFTNIGNQNRNLLAGVNTTTGLANSFNPNVQGSFVNAITLDASNNVYFVGYFSLVGASTRNNAGAVNSSGTVLSWNPDPNSEVTDLAIDGSTIYLSGHFSSLNGGANTRAYLASTNLSGAATTFSPLITGPVYGLLKSGSKLYCSGSISDVNGSPRNHLIAFDLPSGTLNSFNPTFNSTVYKSAISNNSIFSVGNFSSLNSIPRSQFVAFNKSSSQLMNFELNHNNSFSNIITNGTDLIPTGNYTVLNGHVRGGFAVYSLPPTNCPDIITPTITAGGPLSFCANSSVTLTASAGYASYLWTNGATSSSITVNQPGSYSVIITDACNYSAVSSPVTVTVLSSPSVTITPVNPQICPGGNIQLTANAIAPGKGISFDGINSYADQGGWFNNDEFTIALWVRQNSNQNTYAGILDNQGIYGANWSLRGKASPVQDGYEFTVGNGSSIQSINLPLQVQQWQHIAIVFSQTNQTLKGYIDGVLIDSISFSGTLFYNGAQYLTIGRSYWYGTYWKGEVDELQMFNYAMSQSQINTIKNQTASPGTTGLIGLYLFEEASGTSATDLSSGGHDFNFQNNVTRTNPSTVPAANYLFVPTYAWSPSIGLSAANIANPVAQPTSSQTYTVSVSNPSSGCSTTATRTVSVTSNPNPTITANGPLSFCAGGSVILDAGSGYNSYLWSNGSTSQTITASSSGSYSVIITGSGGCTGSSQPVTVSVNNNPTPTISPSGSLVFCQGGSVNLTASSGIAYLWSTGATTQSISVSVSGSYSVSVTTSQGCSGTSNPTTVTVNPIPSVTISAGGPTTFCQGGSVNLDAGSHSTFLWSTGATSQSISATSSGSYSVIISGSGGCTASASIYVNVIPTPTPAISPSGTVTICNGQQQLLDGPGGYQTYAWSNGETTEDISVAVAGSYSLTVTDNNGCTGTSPSTTVQTNSGGSAIVTAGGPTSFCSGDSVLLSTNLGTAYLWNTGATTQSIYVSVSGAYSATVSNGLCVATSSPVNVIVYQNPNPTILPSGSVSICQNGNVILSTQSFNGYLWSTGQTSQSIIVTSGNDYSVTVSDSNNCSATSAITNVVVHPNPTPNITANGPTNFCIGGSVVLDAGNTYASYAWSNGATTSSVNISNSGYYTVTVTDSIGCLGIANQYVNVSTNIPLLAVNTNAPLCRGAELHLNAYGATNYLWTGPSFSSANQLIVIPNVQTTNAGTYTVIGSNPGGCTASSTLNVAISSNHAPQLTFSGIQAFTNHLVMPQAGEPSDRFRFQVTYSDADGERPASGYPRLLLDFENNGSYLDANDKILIMHEVNITDQNVIDGKDYYYEIIGLEPSVYYSTTIVANDSSGCEIVLGPLTEPQVRRGADLTIFANDITFSNSNPNPGSMIAVTAKVHNYTGSSAQNFTVRLKNQFAPGTIYPDQIIPYLGPYQDVLVIWNITTPANPAWCPMQVLVDYTNVIEEPNELDNQAIRPFQNGQYNLPGDIYLTASPVSDTAAACGSVTILGSAYYRNTAIPLPDSSCAGATVTCTIVETGISVSGYSNSLGDYSITFEPFGGPGLYHVNVSITDYTLDGDTTTQFVLVLCPQGSGGDVYSGGSGGGGGGEGGCYIIRDLAPRYLVLQGSLAQQNVVVAGDSLSGSVEIINLGCDSVTRSSIVNVILPDGSPVPGPYVVPPLAQGESFAIDLGYMVFPNAGNTFISVTCDYADSVSESNEFNNTEIVDILVLPAIPDIIPTRSNVTGENSKLKCELPSLVYQINNEGPVSTGSFNSRMRIYRNGILESTQIKNISNILPQGTTDLTFPLSLIDTGLYSFSIDCDFQNAITEISELNNTKTDSIFILPCKADLTIRSCGGIFVQPADPNSGDTMRVTTNIFNTGQVTAHGPFVVDFNIDGTRYSTVVTDSIQMQMQKSVSVFAVIPVHGNHTISVEPDSGNSISEFDEDNLTTEYLCWDFSPTNNDVCRAPDARFIPSSYSLNLPLVLKTGIYNSGIYEATHMAVRFEISGPGLSGWVTAGSTSFYMPHTCNCPIVASLPVPFSFPQSGNFQIRITADPLNQYVECDDSNNQIIVPISITSFPDYRILSQYIAPSLLNPEPNEPISFDVTYENIGAYQSDSMELFIKGDTSNLDSIRVQPLLNASFRTVHISQQWSSSVRGIHIIRAGIDHDDEIVESDELNNEATRAIIVGKSPNLLFTASSISNANPLSGSLVQLSATIKNVGYAECTGIYALYYLDNSNMEVLIGQRNLRLDSAESISFTIPWFVADQRTTLIGRLMNAVPVEFNTDDNEFEIPIGQLNIAAYSLPASCAHNGTGLAVVNVSGGLPPYFIQWNTGEYTDSIRGASGTYYVSVSDAENNTLFDTISIECSSYANDIRINAILSGFYESGTQKMRAVIDPINLDTIADSIIVMLADTLPPFTILYSDTTLLSTNGESVVHFSDDVVQRSYFVVLRHRNHLETWSSIPLSIRSSGVLLDFTVAANKSYGNNSCEVSPGKWAIWSGDVNQDGVVDSDDLMLVENATKVFLRGYLPEDLTGDHLVESSDYSLVDTNVGLMLIKQRP